MSKDSTSTRRQLIKTTAIGATSLGIAGCSSNNEGEATTDAADNDESGLGGDDDNTETTDSDREGEEIKVWAMPPHIGVAKSLIPSFEEKYPKYKVVVESQPRGKIMDKLTLALKTQENLPHCSMVFGLGYATSAARSGAMMDMTDFLKERGHLSRIFKSSLAQISVDGRVYGGNTNAGAYGFFYLPKVFEKAGIPTDPEELEKEIQTWDEFIEVGKQLKKKTGAYLFPFPTESGPPVMTSKLLMKQVNGYLYQKSGKEAKFNFATEENIAAFEQAKEIRDSGIAADVSSFSERFNEMVANGKIAGTTQGTYHKAFVKGFLPETEGDWRAMKIPKFSNLDSTRGAHAGGAAVMVPAALPPAKREGAMLFTAHWNMSEESYPKKFDSGLVPSHYRPDHPLLEEEMPVYGDQKGYKKLIEISKEMPLSFRPPTPEISRLTQEAIRQIMVKDQPIKQTIEEINGQMLNNLEEEDKTRDLSFYEKNGV